PAVGHAAIQGPVEVPDGVQNAAGPVDLVNHAVLVGDRRHAWEGAPLVGLGRLVADDLQVVCALVKGEPERHGAGSTGRTLESVSAPNLLVDLVQYGDLAD